MSNQKKQLKDLLKNLKNNKDAVVVIGDRSDRNILKIDESTKKDYNRKNMIKNPKEFWTFYRDSIYNQDIIKSISEKEKAINKLLVSGCVKTVIDLTYTGNITAPSDVNVIRLKGDVNKLRCMSCEKEYPVTQDILDSYIENGQVAKCSCNGKIAPTMIMFGEKYKEKDITASKESVFKNENDKVELNTSTLIFIDVDFEEDYIHEMMESYQAIQNSSDDNNFTVMICEKDGISIEYYKPDFATFEDIPDSIKRLLDNLNSYVEE